MEPQDYNGIVHTIEQFYRMEKNEVKEMGLNGRKYLDENLKREISINKYRNLLKQL